MKACEETNDVESNPMTNEPGAPDVFPVFQKLVIKSRREKHLERSTWTMITSVRIDNSVCLLPINAIRGTCATRMKMPKS